MLLAGDIGGTKTALGVFSPDGGPRAPLAQAEYHSAAYPSLAAIVREFIAPMTLHVEAASFAVAGPVIDGRAKITNLPWVLDQAALARELELDAVYLLNDVEALAYAVPSLKPDDLLTLNTGEPKGQGTIAVIAPGTGLGESFLTWDGTEYRAHGSEGGHADFAPADELQVGLLTALLRRYDHVSWERVCSGIGIPAIYDYLRERGYAPESPELARRLAAAEDRTPLIMEGAIHPAAPCPLCVATFRTFAAILGAEAGNLALKVLATGGVYIGGGIPLHTLSGLEHSELMIAFRRKGRLADLMASIPVHIIVHRAALAGAATYGLTLLQEAIRVSERAGVSP